MVSYCYTAELGSPCCNQYLAIGYYHGATAVWSTLADMHHLRELSTQRFNEGISSFLGSQEDVNAIINMRSIYRSIWYYGGGQCLPRTAAFAEFTRRLREYIEVKDYDRCFRYTSKLPEIAADFFSQHSYTNGTLSSSTNTLCSQPSSRTAHTLDQNTVILEHRIVHFAST
jgi:hypothetical protein